ncbi:MAG: hypothetical protein JWM27_395 [Gemmatimonadetes bacterium]|nr:hypothetical protein [Gemmatimonadota bacterium]
MSTAFTKTDIIDSPVEPMAMVSSSSQLPPPIGTGCMACCSGGVDPSWGGVSAASSVAI